MSFLAPAGYADTLATPSIFQKSFPDERSEGFKKSVLSDISFLTVAFSIAAHYFEGGTTDTLPKTICDEFRNSKNILDYIKEHKIDLIESAQCDNGVVSFLFKRGDRTQEARISARENLNLSDDESEWPTSERFVIQIVDVAGTHIRSAEELERLEIGESGSFIVDNKDWEILIEWMERLLPQRGCKAFYEILKNSFVHGNKKLSFKHISIAWETKGGKTVVYVSDEGRRYFNAESLFNMTDEQALARRERGRHRDSDGDDLWLSGYMLGLYLSKKNTDDIKIIDIKDASGAKVGTKVTFAVTSFAEENRIIKETPRQIKLPDFSPINFQKMVEDAPSIEEYYERNKGDKGVISRIAHKEDDPLYAGKVTYMFGRIKHITAGPEDMYKVVEHNVISSTSGGREGEILVYYNKAENAITVLLETAQLMLPIVPGRNAHEAETRGERGWDRAEVKIYFDWGHGVSMIDHKASEMALSRNTISILLEDAEMPARFPDLYRCLKEFLILRKVDNDLRITESRNEGVVPLGLLSKINASLKSAAPGEIRKVEDFMHYKSWAVRGIALDVLRRLDSEGVISDTRFKKNETIFETLWIEEDLVFIERFMAEDPKFVDEVLAGMFGQGVSRNDIKAVSVKWIGNGKNKNIYTIDIVLKDGRTSRKAISTIRHDPIGQGFDSKNINRSQGYWKVLAENCARLVPRFITHRWVLDYRPRIADRDLPMSDPSKDPEDIGRNAWIYNNISVVVRDFIEGRDLGAAIGDANLASAEKRAMIKAALDAYLDIWNTTKDSSGRGLFIGDPKPANVVIDREGEHYRAVNIDLDALREFDGFDAVREAVIYYPEYKDFDIIYESGQARAAWKKPAAAQNISAEPLIGHGFTQGELNKIQLTTWSESEAFSKTLAELEEIIRARAPNDVRGALLSALASFKAGAEGRQLGTTPARYVIRDRYYLGFGTGKSIGISPEFFDEKNEFYKYRLEALLRELYHAAMAKGISDELGTEDDSDTHLDAMCLAAVLLWDLSGGEIEAVKNQRNLEAHAKNNFGKAIRAWKERVGKVARVGKNMAYLWDSQMRPLHVKAMGLFKDLPLITDDSAEQLSRQYEDYLAGGARREDRAERERLRAKLGLGKDEVVAYYSMEYALNYILRFFAGGLGALAGDHARVASDRLPQGSFVAVGAYYRLGYLSQSIDKNNWQQEVYERMRIEEYGEIVKDGFGNDIIIDLPMPGSKTLYAKAWKVDSGRTTLYLMTTDIDENDEHDRSYLDKTYDADGNKRIVQEYVVGVGGERLLARLGIKSRVIHLNEGHVAFAILEKARQVLIEKIEAINRREGLDLKIENIGRMDPGIREQYGLTLKQALDAVRPMVAFTSHTPVEAGNQKFQRYIAEGILNAYLKEFGGSFKDLDFKPIVRDDGFDMTEFALTYCASFNGVSRKHAAVCRDMYKNTNTQAVAVTGSDRPEAINITNAVHREFYQPEEMKKLLEGKLRQLKDTGGLPQSVTLDSMSWDEARKLMNQISDEELGYVYNRMRDEGLRELLNIRAGALEEGARILPKGCGIDPDAFIVVFARRMAGYKRPNLVLEKDDDFNVEAWRVMVREARRLGKNTQIIFAGKTHPSDDGGKRILQKILHVASCDEELKGTILFIENYDLEVAKALAKIASCTLNNPKPPEEASGTSGMKFLMAGKPSISIMDGWTLEAISGGFLWGVFPFSNAKMLADIFGGNWRFRNGDGKEIAGIAAGSVLSHGEEVRGRGVVRRCLDPLCGNVWTKGKTEEEPLECPKCHGRAITRTSFDELGLMDIFFNHKERWCEIMRESMAMGLSYFTTDRMFDEYVNNAYIPRIEGSKGPMAEFINMGFKENADSRLRRWKDGYDRTIYGKMDRIHEMNHDLIPPVQEGKVIYHVIPRSLIPKSPDFNQQNSFVEFVAELNRKYPNIREKNWVVNDEQLNDPQGIVRAIAATEDDIAKNLSRLTGKPKVEISVEADFALANESQLGALSDDMRALIFEPQEANDLGDFGLLNGILAALRALRIDDYSRRVDKLSMIHKLLTDEPFANIPPSVDSWKSFAKIFKFRLSAIVVKDKDELKRLNDRLEYLIRHT